MKRAGLILLMLLCGPLAPAFAEVEWADRGCAFIGGDMSKHPYSIALEVGAEAYAGEVLSLNGSLTLLSHEDVEETLGGLKLGVRAALPARISPFVGLGAYYGYAEESRDADEDGIDNDGDGFIDEAGEDESVVTSSMATAYPEIGLHLWVTDSARLTLRYAYNLSSFGRRSDFEIVGLSFGMLFP